MRIHLFDPEMKKLSMEGAMRLLQDLRVQEPLRSAENYDRIFRVFLFVFFFQLQDFFTSFSKT